MSKTFSVLAFSAILGLVVGCSNAPTAQVRSEQSEREIVTQNPLETPKPAIEAQASLAQTPSEDNSRIVIYAEEGIAIRGADPVAYFTQGRYVPGSSEFEYQWANVTWRFSSAENRDLFASNLQHYTPQYGGFCAWAVSQGYTAPVDPTAWKIVDGKLYLNFNRNIQRRWERDIPGNIVKANNNWPGLLSELLKG